MTGYADSLKEQYKNRTAGKKGAANSPHYITSRIMRLIWKLVSTSSEGGTGTPSKHNHLAEKYNPTTGTHCWYCDRMFYFARSVRFRGILIRTKEHIQPKSRGGHNYLINQIAACQDCNHLKGSFTLKEFIHFLRSQCPKEMHTFRKTMITRAYKLQNKRKFLIKKP